MMDKQIKIDILEKQNILLTKIQAITINQYKSDSEKVREITILLTNNYKCDVPNDLLVIIERICISNNIPITAFFSKCRKTEIVLCRHIFAYEIYKNSHFKKYSKSYIAKLINIDHATFAFNNKKANELIETKDKLFIEYYNNYKNYKNE